MTASRPVFIHISKTAGSSIVASAGDQIVNAGHRVASSWVAEHGRAAPLFCVVRHPYERVRSEYTYRRLRFEQGERNAHLANLDLPFDDWVIATYEGEQFRTRAFLERTDTAFWGGHMVDDELVWFLPQTRWVSAADDGDRPGELLVDEVLRFEQLDDDWTAFCGRHGLQAPLRHLNASPTPTDVRERFTDRVREVIHRAHRVDFDTFGYTP